MPSNTSTDSAAPDQAATRNSVSDCQKKNRLGEASHRQQPALAEQRDELVRRDEKPDEIDEGESPLEDEPRVPVGGRTVARHGAYVERICSL
jgi:hypothetical protein